MLKRKTPRNKAYLDWLKDQRCVICGRQKDDCRDIVPAHQSITGRGMGLKPSDYEALPECSFCHAEEHYHGTKSTWKDLDKKRLIIEHLTKYLQEINYIEKFKIS